MPNTLDFKHKTMSENAAPFTGGFLMASWGSFSILHDLPTLLQINVPGTLELYALKVLATLILGAVGGVGGMLAKDLYRYFKNKLKK